MWSWKWEWLVFLCWVRSAISICIECLEDIGVVVGFQLADMGKIWPTDVEDSTPSDFHFVFAEPSLVFSALEDLPFSLKPISLFKATVSNIVFLVSKELDVIDLRTVCVWQTFSDEVKAVFAFPALESDFLFVDFVITGKEFSNNFSVELNGKSVAILVP